MSICEKNLRVSVVIPAYNAAKFLKETVDSILNQTVLPSEIIIVDDQSSDETYFLALKIAESATIPIRVQCQTQNNGASAARNKGIEVIKSDWVLFMDADDIAEPELIEQECRRVCELQEEWETPLVLVHSAYRQVTHDGTSLGIHKWKQVQPEEILGYEIVRNQIITTSGVLVNKAAFNAAGGFDTNLNYSEDWDLWLRLAHIGGFGYVDKPLVGVRRHAGNISGTLANMLSGEKVVLQRYDISFIEQAINKRELPWEVNQVSFIELLFRLGKWEEGYLFVSTLIDQYPTLACGQFLDSLYHLYHQSWDKAKKSLLSAIQYNPQHGAALNNLGAILAIQGECSQAKEYFTRAIKLLPTYIDANNNLSILGKYGVIPVNEAKFTWRELRPVLLSYTE